MVRDVLPQNQETVQIDSDDDASMTPARSLNFPWSRVVDGIRKPPGQADDPKSDKGRCVAESCFEDLALPAWCVKASVRIASKMASPLPDASSPEVANPRAHVC